MHHQFAIQGAGWGALVGWATALLLTVMAWGLSTVDEVSPWEQAGFWTMVVVTVLLVPSVLGIGTGLLCGALCGMGAAMAVGRRTDPRAARPLVVLGAMLLPVLLSLTLGWWPLLLPAAVGTALLVRATPAILADPGRGRSPRTVH